MEIIEILKILLLSVIEGITEWLPISSTGHMILLDELIQIDTSDIFKEMYFVIIQLGALLAVVVLYFEKLFPFNLKSKSKIKKDILNLWFKILVACIPAAIVGIFFEDKINDLFYNYRTVTFTLIFYGIVIIIIEKRHKNQEFLINNITALDYKTAFIIGLFQLLSLIPGTSRSGVTIIGAMLIGTSRSIAAEFTFFLGIPIMLGASIIKLLKFGLIFSTNEIVILIIGLTTTFVVSILTIKFLLSFIKSNDFQVFGYYRIVLGIILILYVYLF